MLESTEVMVDLDLDLEATVSVEEEVDKLEHEEKQEQEVKADFDLESTVSVEEEADWVSTGYLSNPLDCDMTIVCQVMYNYKVVFSNLCFTIIFRMARRCCLGCY